MVTARGPVLMAVALWRGVRRRRRRPEVSVPAVSPLSYGRRFYRALSVTVTGQAAVIAAASEAFELLSSATVPGQLRVEAARVTVSGPVWQP